MTPIFLLYLMLAQPPADPTVAATVNGEVIRLDEVDAVLKRRPAADSPLTAGQTKQLRLAALEALIDDRLFRQFLDRNGPKVESAEVEKLMDGLKAALKKRGRSLSDYLKETGKSETELRAVWTTMLRFQKLVDRQATPEVLKAYHAAHRDVFDRVEVRVSDIVVRIPAGSLPGEWTGAWEKLARVRAEIVSGKYTFAAAAKKYSVSPSASAGGDLGFVGRRDGRFDEPIVAAAFALKTGEVSGPV
ncbi:MAG TPA: peptidylprolyl isomerase, partial [Fimbriiglobus sp.]